MKDTKFAQSALTKFAQSALLVGCHDVLKEVLEEQHTAEQDWAQDGTLQSSVVETPNDSQSSEVGMTTRRTTEQF